MGRKRVVQDGEEEGTRTTQGLWFRARRDDGMGRGSVKTERWEPLKWDSQAREKGTQSGRKMERRMVETRVETRHTEVYDAQARHTRNKSNNKETETSSRCEAQRRYRPAGDIEELGQGGVWWNANRQLTVQHSHVEHNTKSRPTDAMRCPERNLRRRRKAPNPVSADPQSSRGTRPRARQRQDPAEAVRRLSVGPTWHRSIPHTACLARCCSRTQPAVSALLECSSVFEIRRVGEASKQSGGWK
ncbi:hypothetical protein QBC39DRAFT_111167 [Podospora conica]|nr:hypothetical protein QBC39DRAFT_111167 [Schizothecium conicum]